MMIIVVVLSGLPEPLLPFDSGVFCGGVAAAINGKMTLNRENFFRDYYSGSDIILVALLFRK